MARPRLRTVILRFLVGVALASVPATASVASGPTLERASARASADLSMAARINQYMADHAALKRLRSAPMSTTRRARLRAFHEATLAELATVDFDALDRDGRIDWILLDNQARHELRLLDLDAQRAMEVEGLLPFAGSVVELIEARERMEPVEPSVVAARLDELSEVVKSLESEVRSGPGSDDEPEVDGEAADSLAVIDRTIAFRAARLADELRRALGEWYRFRAGYDPIFTWWVRKPYERADADLREYADLVRRRLAGVEQSDEDPIVGDPIGREALLAELGYEMIGYTPEQLIEIAEREYAWCLERMLEASRALGFGDDWKAALEHVKGLHVQPGEQPELIRSLALEAIDFLRARDLVTIPDLCVETWRMQMMSPARQKVSPYFLGGESIIVSFPTDGMEHRDKLMSLRGNNIHFARATVHHELIPGHHLQQFMNQRYRPHRRVFRTPFWVEGWALYWEMLLWDLDFAESPENEIGMLFWRMHRCARIIFSLRFHLGEMTPEEAIDFLVENVGHERNNATAEVRRSVGGDYGPLYQAAYMLGGLQIRALRSELVDSGRMTERDFHDAVLRENAIPIELVRRSLSGDAITLEPAETWRFYDVRSRELEQE